MVKFKFKPKVKAEPKVKVDPKVKIEPKVKGKPKVEAKVKGKPKEKVKTPLKERVKNFKSKLLTAAGFAGAAILPSLFGGSNDTSAQDAQANADKVEGAKDAKDAKRASEAASKGLNKAASDAAKQESAKDIRQSEADLKAAEEERSLQEQILKASQALDKRTKDILHDYGLESSRVKRPNRGFEGWKNDTGSIPTDLLTKADITKRYERKTADPRLGTIIKMLGASNELLGNVQFNISVLIKQGGVYTDGKLKGAQTLNKLAQADYNAANTLNSKIANKGGESQASIIARLPGYLADRASLERKTDAASNGLDLAALLGLAPIVVGGLGDIFSEALSNIVADTLLDKPKNEKEESALEVAKRGAFDSFVTNLKILAGTTTAALLGETWLGKKVKQGATTAAKKTTEKLTERAAERQAEKTIRKSTLGRNAKAAILKSERKAQQKLAKTTAGKVAKKASEKLAKSALGKASAKFSQKILKMSALKLASKTVAKKIPILGSLCGLYYAVDRWSRGDWVAGLGELSSGIVAGLGSLTGIVSGGAGTVAAYAGSFAIDAALLASDYTRAKEALDKGDIKELRKLDWQFGDIAQIAAGLDGNDPLKVNFNKVYPDVKSVLSDYGTDGLANLLGVIDSLKGHGFSVYDDFYKNYNTVEKLLNAGVSIKDIARAVADNPNTAIANDFKKHPEYIALLMKLRGPFNTADVDAATIAQSSGKGSAFYKGFEKLYGDPATAAKTWGEQKTTWNIIKKAVLHPIDFGAEAAKELATSVADRAASKARTKTSKIGKAISYLTFGFFRKGGKLQGPSHEQGGIDLGNNNEAEGGEYVVNKEATAKHEPLIEAINNDGLKKGKVDPANTSAGLDSHGNLSIDTGVQNIEVDQSKLNPAILALAESIKYLRLEFQKARQVNDTELKEVGADYKFSNDKPSKGKDKEKKDGVNGGDDSQLGEYGTASGPGGEGNLITTGEGGTQMDWLNKHVVGKVNQYGGNFQEAGNGIISTDCSSMVQTMYLQTTGQDIGRTSRDQWANNKGVIVESGVSYAGASGRHLQPGDVLFFTQGGQIHHVEVYVGNGRMIGTGSSGKRNARSIHALEGSGLQYAGAKRYVGNTSDLAYNPPSGDADSPSSSVVAVHTTPTKTSWKAKVVPMSAGTSYEESDESFPIEGDNTVVANGGTKVIYQEGKNTHTNTSPIVTIHNRTNIVHDDAKAADLV